MRVGTRRLPDVLRYLQGIERRLDVFRELLRPQLVRPHRQVLAVGDTPQAVPFVRIGQEVGGLAVVAECVVEAQRIVEVNRGIRRTVHDQEGRARLVGMRTRANGEQVIQQLLDEARKEPRPL